MIGDLSYNSYKYFLGQQMNIAILNYKIGNLASVQNALAYASKELKHITITIESNPYNLMRYDKIILPGVGAFGDAMEHLRISGMQEAIMEFAKSGKYMLGICLGMQLLFEQSSEFGEHRGLGLLRGIIEPFDRAKLGALKVPHVGWNKCFLTEEGKKNTLFLGLEEEFYLYFVHSFCNRDSQNVLAQCEYGYTFSAIVGRDNIFGIQPHPEKSHKVGLQLLKNFVSL